MTTETSRPTASQHHRNTVEINRVMRELVEKRTAVNLKLVSSVLSLDDKVSDALSAEFDKLTAQIVSLKVALVENDNQYAEYTWHIDPESADPENKVRFRLVEHFPAEDESGNDGAYFVQTAEPMTLNEAKAFLAQLGSPLPKKKSEWSA